MKIIKWAILLFILILVFLWILYFYLQRQAVIPKSIRLPVTVEKNNVEAVSKQASWEETVVAFCKALYDGGDISPYATERVKATVIPPGENTSKTTVKIQTKIDGIRVYSRNVTDDSAESIVAITRSVSVQSASTTQTDYILLQLHKQDVWRIQDITFLTNVPSQ
ncbi:hypothetical protein [Ectobacillus sp. sgz5001026]|uniref:hypothetical protein n=1 Tax=Ectobacillus sp. sgz5001026 TaxID=3242473 RepID=UPI0036D3201A